MLVIFCVAGYAATVTNMADDYDQWMRMGNEYYAKNDLKAARECWANAEKLRPLSPADVLLLKAAIARAVQRGD